MIEKSGGPHVKVECRAGLTEVVAREALIKTFIVGINRFNLRNRIFKVLDVIIGNSLAVLVPFFPTTEKDLINLRN